MLPTTLSSMTNRLPTHSSQPVLIPRSRTDWLDDYLYYLRRFGGTRQCLSLTDYQSKVLLLESHLVCAGSDRVWHDERVDQLRVELGL